MTLPNKGPFAAFWTNKAAEAEGVWIEAPGQFRVKLRRAGPGNKPYQKALKDDYLDRFTDFNADEAVTAAQDVYSRTIIVDWDCGEGSEPHTVPGIDGEPVTFSAEAAAKLFADVPEFWEWVIACAQDRERFRVEMIEADAKNS